MADSPENDASALVSVSIRSDGQPIPDTMPVLSITTSKKVGRIPWARIVLADGDVANQMFPVSDSKSFEPGAVLEIKAGYDGAEETIFKGVVVTHGLRLDSAGPSRLVVECRDEGAAMTVDRRNAVHIDKKDSDILSSLISDAGLKADVDATSTVWAELVQYYCTDWDFLVSRAEANGRLVVVDDGLVSVKKPDAGAPVLTVTYGVDLLEFEADVDAASQVSGMQAASWSPKTQEVVTSKPIQPADVTGQGNLTGADLAKVLKSTSYRMQTAAPMDKPALDAWTEGQQLKAGLARIRGRMSFQGNAKPKPATSIELVGMGDRFNGDVLVTAVQHRIDAGRWVTDVEFGLDPDWLADRRDLAAPPASGLLPGIDGLHIGVVKKLDADPAGEHRVEVSVPLHGSEAKGVWARMATFYGSAAAGAFFVPEIEDEVVLGYLNGDPSAPVILGSLYSSKRPPPQELTAENNIKTLVTRGQLTVEYDDEKKAITVMTPAENRIVLDDEAKAVTIEDQNGNSVVMNDAGVAIESAKDITIKAGGKVAIEATGAIGLTATADVTVDGKNVTNTAKMAFAGKGNASAELSASGQTTVKGAMVMIN